jgi:hypothetical protein
MNQYATNKWVLFALGLGAAVLGFLAKFDWTSLLEAKTAGIVVGLIGIIQAGLAAISPSAGSQVQPTDSGSLKGLLFTHKAIDT